MSKKAKKPEAPLPVGDLPPFLAGLSPRQVQAFRNLGPQELAELSNFVNGRAAALGNFRVPLAKPTLSLLLEEMTILERKGMGDATVDLWLADPNSSDAAEDYFRISSIEVHALAKRIVLSNE